MYLVCIKYNSHITFPSAFLCLHPDENLKKVTHKLSPFPLAFADATFSLPFFPVFKCYQVAAKHLPLQV